jgi:hypothetical protein
MPRTSKAFTGAEVGLKHGFRSGLEDKIAAQLRELRIPFAFEDTKVEYKQPEKARKYTPDFFIPRREGMGGIFIETKGRFLTEDRQKHLHVRTCNPDLDIRFVFSNANQRISKQSSTTYAMWAERNGFQWAHRSVPLDWIRGLGYHIPESL